jgi:hypothetical protein
MLGRVGAVLERINSRMIAISEALGGFTRIDAIDVPELGNHLACWSCPWDSLLASLVRYPTRSILQPTAL